MTAQVWMCVVKMAHALMETSHIPASVIMDTEVTTVNFLSMTVLELIVVIKVNVWLERAHILVSAMLASLV